MASPVTTFRDTLKAAVVAALPSAVASASYKEPSTDVSSLAKDVVYVWVWPIDKVRTQYRDPVDNRYVYGVQVIRRLSVGDNREEEIDAMLVTMDTMESALADVSGVLNFDDDETGRPLYDHDALSEQNAFVSTLRPVAVGVV